MQLLFFCPIWGMMDLPLPVALNRIKAAGYDGVEYACQLNEGRREEFITCCRDLELLYINQQYGARGKTFADYVKNFREQLYYHASFNPVFVNSQTGKDYFSMEENIQLLHVAQEIQEETGTRILHETHRGKFSYSAYLTSLYIRQMPGLQLTGDFSHFCTVSESFLEDQHHILEQLIPRIMHIHARVGYSQGPQVSDPRLPEWKTALDHHLGWWKSIIDHHKKTGTSSLTITTEFGPPPYMPVTPFTQQPVASQWEINLFMKELLKQRFV